jgi:hypothetical protein
VTFSLTHSLTRSLEHMSLMQSRAGLTVVIRMYYVHAVNLTDDFLYATSNVSIWSMIEPAIGICCMAASTYRPLFKSLIDKTSMLSTHKFTQVGGEGKMGKNGSGNVHTRKGSEFEDGIMEGQVECKAEGPGKGKGNRRRSKQWEGGEEDWKDGIVYTTRVEIKRSKSTREPDDI